MAWIWARSYFKHNVVSCFSSKIGVGLASGQALCCTNLRGLLRIRRTEGLVQGPPPGLAGRQFGADAQLEVLVLAEHSLHSW